MSRPELTPEERADETRAWKADLRSTPEGERAYQEMYGRVLKAAGRRANRRSA